MGCKDRTYLCLSLLVFLSVLVISAGQNFWKISQVDEQQDDKRIKIVWCTTNRNEQHKCYNLAMANERDQLRVGYDAFKLDCLQAPSKDECMNLIDQEKATLTSVDAGEVFNGGRFNSLVPIAQQVPSDGAREYYAVAAIKKDKLKDVQALPDLRGKRACFAGVETFAGWILPIYTLMREGGMDIVDCNNHVKSASRFFGASCAVNCLTAKYNPIGDNSDKLCQLCIGRIPGGRCTDADPYAGFEGAFRCLLEVGEIAFLKHTTIPELVAGDEFTSISKESFELLCKDGSRRPVDDYAHCNWGRVPSDAIVTTSAASAERRKKLQLFLEKVVEVYGRGLHQNFTRPAPTEPNYYDGHRPESNYNDNSRPESKYYDNNRGQESNDQGRQPEYDQFGNRRNKRQESTVRDPNRAPPTSNDNEFGQNRLTQYGQSENTNQDGNIYNRPSLPLPFNVNDNNRVTGNDADRDRDRNQYDPDRDRNQYDADRDRDRNQYDPDRDRNQQQFDPFARDPFTINREQIGINIDPYQDANYNSRNPIYAFDNRNQATPQPEQPNFNFANVSFYEDFNLFESTPRYGLHGNLLFQDATRRLEPLSENQQTYSGFLGRSLDVIMGVRECQVNRMTLCVTSDMENSKCVKMRTALKSQLLKPELECYKGHSQIHCMQAIRSGLADITVLDASDVYTAGLNFDLVPFISEVYNLNEPEYYVVAVAKESDPSTEITYLRGKYTCHGGINTAAGWIYPLAFLISNGWIRPYGCNSIRAAAEYFTKSCVPGALSTEYNTGVPYDNMCDLCHGASYRYCRRDASEDYYGHTGAFRCLVEGGGHVAFVKHTTVTENTGGKRAEWWARDNLNDDFELLCPDGTRAEINDYERCNLGKVKANAVVARGGDGGYNETHVNAFINLFLYAQTLFGSKTNDEFSFSMFSSAPPYTDLIFQDATTKLKVIHPTQRHYALYLGSDFMRARRIVDCHAGSSTQNVSVYTLLVTTIFTFFLVLR